MVRIIEVKLLERTPKGSVLCGPTDHDLWDAEIRLGQALAAGHICNASHFRERIIALRSAGIRRTAERRRKFTALELIEMKIARAAVDGNDSNVRYFIEQRWKEMIFQVRRGR